MVNRGEGRRMRLGAVAATAVATATISFATVLRAYRAGWLLYYGDAESHLNHARRVFDSRTPGLEQFGTVWLPMPHLLMLPFIANNTLWHTGLAGAVPSAICFVAATTFLFAATRRLSGSFAIGTTSAAVFALNPNMLYLQAVPMSEPAFFMALLGLLYFLVQFQQSQSIVSIVGAGCMALVATLTRYEGWLLLPLTALVLFTIARRRAVWTVLIFLAIATIGPFGWLAYNWWISGNALEFYNGPYSPMAIQGGTPYPGQGNWRLSILYLMTVGRLTSGTPLFWLGCAGSIVLIWKRVVWPVALLAGPPLLVIWSLHSGGTPIQSPGMPYPDRWYNTRYGLCFLPLLAFSISTMTIFVAPRRRKVMLCLDMLAAISPWFFNHSPEDWITWKESEINSQARRAWTGDAARYLKLHFRDGDTIFTGSGDVNGIFRQAGIPLRQTLSVDNGLFWDAARLRPDLFLGCQWVVALLTPDGRSDGDRVKSTIGPTREAGPYYELVLRIESMDGKVVEIYHRTRISGSDSELFPMTADTVLSSAGSHRNRDVRFEPYRPCVAQCLPMWRLSRN